MVLLSCGLGQLACSLILLAETFSLCFFRESSLLVPCTCLVSLDVGAIHADVFQTDAFVYFMNCFLNHHTFLLLHESFYMLSATVRIILADSARTLCCARSSGILQTCFRGLSIVPCCAGKINHIEYFHSLSVSS